MKYLVLLLFTVIFLFPEKAICQSEVEIEEEIFVVVETMPEFKGGNENLFSYIGKNVEYPKQAKEDEIEGMVIVSFVVEKDGSISNPKVLRGAHPLLDEEALRLVSSMPLWKPGLQRGEPVRVQFNLPIRFSLR